MMVIAVFQAIENIREYLLIIHNHVNYAFDPEVSTYEIVGKSYFDKYRPNVFTIHSTDQLYERRAEYFDAPMIRLMEAKKAEMDNVKALSEEYAKPGAFIPFEPKVMKITNPYPRESEPGKKVEQVINTEPKVNRNDPCPCGSGKKNKKCCNK